MICFYCREHVDDEHVCQELADSRHEQRLIHDPDTILYWKVTVRRMAQEREPRKG